MVTDAFKGRIIPLADGSYFQYFEESNSDWIKNPEEFIKLKRELDNLNDKFSASFNVNNGNTKNISIFEVKRFVQDIDSGKINNEKSAIDRYLEYIYPDKKFIDTRNIIEKITVKKGKDKGIEETTNSYIVKKMFHDLVYALFGQIEPRLKEKLDTATGGYDEGMSMPPTRIKSPPSKKEPLITGEGLKIMTPSQLMTRLRILLAQKQAGNNSQKLNNEIKQTIYSLYKSKNL